MGGEGNMSNGNPFDKKFDAGVDADENSDPKKYIQQLTGKLSQTLRDYNISNNENDSDLNKYVAGMIVKQATEGLSEEEKSEIIKKINDTNKESVTKEEPNTIENSNDSNVDDTFQTESKCGKNIFLKKKLKENLGIDSDEDASRIETKINSKLKITPKIKPYTSPIFK